MDNLDSLFEKLGAFTPYKKEIIKSKGEVICNKVTDSMFNLIIIVYMIIPILMIIISVTNLDAESTKFYWQVLAIAIFAIGCIFVFSMLMEVVLGIKVLKEDFTEKKVAKRAIEEIQHDNQYVKILTLNFTVETLKNGISKLVLLMTRKERRFLLIFGEKTTLIPIFIAIFPIISKILEFTISNVWYYLLSFVLLGYVVVNAIVAAIIKGSVINKYIYWQEIITLSLESLDVKTDAAILKTPSTLTERIRYIFMGY